MNTLRRRFALFGFTLFLSVPLLTACPIYPDPYYPPPPLNYDFKGTWLGTLNDSQGGEGALTLVFTYQNTSTYAYGGSWQADFGTSDTQGVFEGQADYGNSVSALLYLAEFPNCALEIRGARDEDTVAGTYRAASFQPEGCTAAAFGLGTFTVTKQALAE